MHLYFLNVNIILAFAATLLCGGLAVFVLFREKRSFANLAFTAGMLVFAVEAALSGFSFRASHPVDVENWQFLRLTASSIVLVCWLLFGLSFGRADYRQVLRKWQWYLFAFLVVPLGLIGLFQESLTVRLTRR